MRRNRHPFEGDRNREKAGGRFRIWRGGNPAERVPAGLLPTKMMTVVARAPDLTQAKRIVKRMAGVTLDGPGWKNARRLDDGWIMITEG